jgi:hypothetical protein
MTLSSIEAAAVRIERLMSRETRCTRDRPGAVEKRSSAQPVVIELTHASS